MKKYIVGLTVFITLGLGFATSSQAQCIACALSIEYGKLKCWVDAVERDGYTYCECAGRCNCSGNCDYSPEAINYIPGINWEDVGIPESGLRLFVPGGYDFIGEEALASAFLGSRKAANLFIGEQFGAFRAKANEYVLYPLVGSEFKLKDCNNEIIGKASRIPSPNT